MSQTLPTELTQKEFAALRGVSEPMVSRWKARQRLVMTDDGTKVRVRESIDLLERTLDPARGGDRTGKQSPSLALPPPSHAARAPDDQPRGSNARYQDAAHDEKRERAAILRLERMELEGKLVFRDRVEQEAQTRATQGRDALVAILDRLPAQLAAESDVEKIRELLAIEIRHVVAQLCANPFTDQQVST